MVGDLINNLYGVQMRVVKVYDGYAYAAPVNSRKTTWRFDDECENPVPIPLTCEILKKNGWECNENFMDMKATDNINFSWTDMYGESLFNNGYHMCDCKYVHTLQHVFRLYGLDELADNFKV